MTSHSRSAKDFASCDTKFCLLREHRADIGRTSGEHRVLADLLLKNFVAASVLSVSYLLNVVEEFRSCLSKPEFFKILSRLTCFITFSLATIQVSVIHVTVTKVGLAQSVSDLHCN